MSHQQKALRWAVGSWSLFIAENLILSENRTEIIQRFGDDNYHAIYGLCSTVACGTILYSGYKIKHGFTEIVPQIAKASPMGQALSFSMLGLGFIFLSQSAPRLQVPFYYENSDTKTVDHHHQQTDALSQWKVRCPFDFHASEREIYGIDRITRHSGLWSFGLIGTGLGMLSTSLPARVWFSMPLMVALIGGEHTDSRYRRNMGGSLTPTQELSSNVPFWGIVSGRQGDVQNVFASLIRDEMKGINAMLALGTAGIIVARKGRASSIVNSTNAVPSFIKK
jgi:uncharacterized membrane protein